MDLDNLDRFFARGIRVLTLQGPIDFFFPNAVGSMKVLAFITDYTAVDRIIEHPELRFVAEKPPPSRSP